MLRRFLIFFLFLSIQWIDGSAQSEQKVGFAKQEYANIVSRYNGYFNGQQKLLEILDKLAAAHVDNYNELLPVFPLGTKEDAENVKDDADVVIKKASFVIQRHEIGRWVDDCYIMIGKAYYYRAEYFTAIESFQYVYNKYKGSPTEVEALIWLARCYLKLDKGSDADNTLQLAQSKFSGKTRHLRKDYHTTYAQYLIQIKNYRKGAEELLNALAYNATRQERARLYYIVSQLYEREGKNDRSIIFYKRVIRKTPPYEVIFNARIAIARLHDISEDAPGKGVEATLNKMLKDEKNSDYKDQIYFTLGTIALKKDALEKAIDYFKLSAANSSVNKQQKGLSFLTIANLYFNRLGKFEMAGMYYDSTLAFLPKDYPEYSRIQYKRDNLQDLILNSKAIYKEDSLQRIAKMEPNERKRFIEKMAKQQQAEQQQAAKLREQQTLNLAEKVTSDDNIITDNTTNASGTWYFYNTSAMGIGFSDFLKKWGRRPLEDNWRRSNKENLNAFQNDENTDSTATGTTDATEGNSAQNIKEKLLIDVPLTREQKALSDDRLIEAFWNLGNIYKEQMRDPKGAIATFDTLNARFPKNKYTLETLYQLYRIYESMGKKDNSIAYEQRILLEYPSSIYAEIIRNPDYAVKANTKANKLNELYENAYKSYLQGDYVAVLNLKTESDNLEPDPESAARFAYLEAQTIGKTKSKTEYIDALKNVSNKYPETLAGKTADENLKYFSTQQ